MPDDLLYHFPGSCSRVAMNALEEIGTPFRARGVALMRGEHHGREFLAINPKAKVPVLVSDGVTRTELPVILYHLANTHRDARLLPTGADGIASLDSLADLVWFAGTLHPFASRLFRPTDISDADPEGVAAKAMRLLVHHAQGLSARLSGGWLYGEAWSIADVFVAWIYDTATKCGFPIADFPVLSAHRERVVQRPSYTRALARERDSVTRDGLELPPGTII